MKGEYDFKRFYVNSVRFTKQTNKQDKISLYPCVNFTFAQWPSEKESRSWESTLQSSLASKEVVFRLKYLYNKINYGGKQLEYILN